MNEVSIVGVDLAKRVFQLHGSRADGTVAFRKKVTRGHVLTVLAGLPKCIVAMEACATAHFWAREIGKLGHSVRLIPPVYVKPFVKRQKNDAADAEAIAEAASRPTMRFVQPKSEQQQARAMVFRTRDLLVRQRTQLINALRAHLAEHGVIAAQGITNVAALGALIEQADCDLDLMVVETARLYLDQIEVLSDRIATLEKVLKLEAARSQSAVRLMTMPGIGPVTAMAVDAFAPSMTAFKRGRDFAAWLGLVPRQHSSGGKQVLGRTSKMGQRDIRRLLIIGAMTVIRWADRKGVSESSWLGRMLSRKPRMLVAIALANKMARSIWAMMTKNEDYRTPALSAA
ncbi:IS110 family transposase [Pelagibacterium lentulum]|uniref:IS110 family transposase n=1 Tax=Pelagibacterium lentulum TaxID=2029865 RepID=A0A916RB15_9HYPH|nr:IS110 family transposase [Pelagibacterium lentulum]GGA43197.1 IS110 family transposase [Pelagibacterium lentulum]